MESPMQAWLLANVPGWDDDVVSAARFKALTGQRSDWEARLLFWKDLILRLARHLNLLVLDAHAVQHLWFLRGGLSPLCLTQALLEMHKCGDLQSLDNLQETQSAFSWFWQHISKRILSGANAFHEQVAGRLILTALVHERIVNVTKSIAENCWTTSCVSTMERLNVICGGEENASIIKRELIRMKRGRIFISEGNTPIKGFKMSLNEDRVSDVSKLDGYMLHLYWTLEKLSAQIDVLEKAYSRSKQSAMEALKHDRRTAKRHIQSMRTLEASKTKCCDFQGKLQEVLAFISQAETTKQVSEAMRTGANALNEHMIPLRDIELCLHDLEAAISGHLEVAEVLGSSVDKIEVDDLDLQLADLELELFSEQSEAAPVVVDEVAPVNHHDEQPKPSVFSVDAVEQAMKGLALA